MPFCLRLLPLEAPGEGSSGPTLFQWVDDDREGYAKRMVAELPTHRSVRFVNFEDMPKEVQESMARAREQKARR